MECARREGMRKRQNLQCPVEKLYAIQIIMGQRMWRFSAWIVHTFRVLAEQLYAE